MNLFFFSPFWFRYFASFGDLSSQTWKEKEKKHACFPGFYFIVRYFWWWWWRNIIASWTQHNSREWEKRRGGFVAIVPAPGHEVIGVSVDPPQQQEKVIYYAISRPLSVVSPYSRQNFAWLRRENNHSRFQRQLRHRNISFPRSRGRFEIQK